MDIFIAILLGLVQLLLGGLGVYVSMKPVPKETHGRYIAGFMVLGMLGLVCTLIQQVRNSRAQDSLKAQLVVIQKNTERPPQIEFGSSAEFMGPFWFG